MASSTEILPKVAESSTAASNAIAVGSVPLTTSKTEESTQEPARQPKEEQLSLGRRIKQTCTTRVNVQFATCCTQAWIAGWNDACAGALLPYIERWYSINFVEVSTLFVGAFCGFVVAGLLNVYLTDRFGMGRVVSGGALCQTLGYVVLLAPPPFALFPVTYALLIGFGIALQMAATVSFLSSLPAASIKMNYSQAAYGVGGMLSPLAATAMTSNGVRFSYFFAVSLGLSFLNFLGLFFAFGRDPDFGPPAKVQRQTTNVESLEMQNQQDQQQAQSDIPLSTSAKNKALLSNKTVWLLALFLCFYVGAEVSIGGWAVSFLLLERGGTANIGYVSTGFWSGITLGRLTLPRLQARLGDTPCLYAYMALAFLLEFSVWFWKSLIGNAVGICLIGFLLSTYFGIAVSTLTKILPRHLHSGAIGLVAAAGQSGSAFFPFATGALAEKFGPGALQPVVIALLVGMAGIWTLVPRVGRRSA